MNVHGAVCQITHAHTGILGSRLAHAHSQNPPVRATAVGSSGQSVQPAVTHATLCIPPVFFKLATLSFAIPPPISASVRSRQAGTETEREASAMEALGPGKEFKEEAERFAASRGVRGLVCANASLHSGPRLQRGLDALTGKHTEAQPERLLVC